MANPLLQASRAEAPIPHIETAETRHIRNTAIVSRDVAGETIVVPICRGVGDLDAVYTFNEVGKELWSLLAEARASRELANWVVERYEVGVEQAYADVQSYLAELREIGLVVSM